MTMTMTRSKQWDTQGLATVLRHTNNSQWVFVIFTFSLLIKKHWLVFPPYVWNTAPSMTDPHRHLTCMYAYARIPAILPSFKHKLRNAMAARIWAVLVSMFGVCFLASVTENQTFCTQEGATEWLSTCTHEMANTENKCDNIPRVVTDTRWFSCTYSL